MACLSLILSSKVNKVDFKCSEGFLEKVAVVDIALKVEAQRSEERRVGKECVP